MIMRRILTNNVLMIVVYAIAALSKSADEDCQPGAYRFQEFCYSYVQVPRSFNESEATCQSRGGQLAIIKDHNTARFIRALHKKMTALYYWIGISDRYSEGIWMYLSDKSALAIKNWGIGKPNDAKKNEDCAVMRTDLGLAWDDVCCCKKYLYICQFEGTSKHCQNKIQFGESCYELSRQRVRFAEAEKSCKIMGGKLAEMKTMDEQLILEDRIHAEVWWKSFTHLQMDQIDDRKYGAWIGAYKHLGKWIYMDGSKADMPFWEVNQPSVRQNTDCVLISDAWKSAACNAQFASFCQFGDNTRQTETAANTTEFPILIVATILCATAIVIIVLAVFIVLYRRYFLSTDMCQNRNTEFYERNGQEIFMYDQQQHPPLPRRDISESSHQSRISDGYLIAGSAYSHSYEEIIDNTDLYGIP